MMDILEQEFIISNKLGIHARVAAQIVKVASNSIGDLDFQEWEQGGREEHLGCHDPGVPPRQ